MIRIKWTIFILINWCFVTKVLLDTFSFLFFLWPKKKKFLFLLSIQNKSFLFFCHFLSFSAAYIYFFMCYVLSLFIVEEISPKISNFGKLWTVQKIFQQKYFPFSLFHCFEFFQIKRNSRVGQRPFLFQSQRKNSKLSSFFSNLKIKWPKKVND